MKTIVLIDSDALSRALLAQCLAGKGWRVVEAENGEAGFELVLQHRPLAVMADIRTPRGNGFKICRQIRETAQLKSTRVILSSVSRFSNDRDSAFEAGASDYLVKPIHPSELLHSLETCTSDKPGDVSLPPEPGVAESTIVRFWGVRGSIPTPGPDTRGIGGNTSCVEVRVGDHVIILDAGSGIRKLGQSLMREFHDRPLNITLLVTHTHWDHIQGFPFFIPAYSPRVNVRILGYGGAVHGLRGALFEQMQSAFFPVGLHQMASHVTFDELADMEFHLGSVKVTAIYANHPGICLGYRLSTNAGDIIYMPDHEMYERHELERQKAAGENSQAALEHAREQDKIVVDFMRDADICITDSQYDMDEYPTRLGWGHTCADDTVFTAVRAGVRQLFLFHHDPDHSDEKIASMVKRAQAQAAASGSSIQVSAAREGLEITLKPATAG